MTIDAALERVDPAQWISTLSYRGRSTLPYDVAAVPVEAPILLDTTVYIDAHAGRLPAGIIEMLGTHMIRHAAPAMAELALPLGYLGPQDPRTPAARAPILETLRRIPPDRVLVPTAEHWIESALAAGTLARIQGIAKADRRKLVSDALIYLVAGEAGATVVTRNLRDFDLLMQIRPGVGVLFYDRP